MYKKKSEGKMVERWLKWLRSWGEQSYLFSMSEEVTFAEPLAIKEIFVKEVLANHVILHLVGEEKKTEKTMF